jgi:TonB family protein
MLATNKNWNVPVLGFLLFAGLSSMGAADRDKKQEDEAERDVQEQVYDMASGITPPRVIRQVNPDYSPGSRGVRVVGTVMVALVVTSGGLPRSLRVVHGLDKDVDQSALDAVKQWRFQPAKKDGKSVAVRITIEIQFRDM